MPSFPAHRSPWFWAAFLAALLVALTSASAASGEADLSLGQSWVLLAEKLNGESPNEALAAVLWEVRLPRLTTAILAGAALGLSGAVFQGLLLNPLADPYTLGVSSGAAFGAALVIAASILHPAWPWLAEPWALTGGAFASAGLTLAAVLALARSDDGHLSPLNLILAGVMVSAILSAAISFIKYLSGDQVGSIVFWLLGSFQARTWTDAGLVMTFFLPAFLVALWSAVDLNILTLGAKSAETLGLNTRRVRLRLLAAASLAAASAVSVAGIIGFVGLVVPHLVRLASGPDHRSLLPRSALGGALLLLAADTAVRVVIPSPGEIPVGVLTALLAGPVFLVIFRRHRHGLARD
jgi:iron complex transport system permease protein